MYRIVTDFHGGWYGWGGLQQLIYIVGNFTSHGLMGLNGTWPDPDMLPLRSEWWRSSGEKYDRGQTIATLWMMARAPLMHAGYLPVDETTLKYLTNSEALMIHDSGSNNRVVGYSGDCYCKGGVSSCTMPRDAGGCIATWASKLPEWTAVALINMGEKEMAHNTTFESVGLKSGTTYTVRDIWSGVAGSSSEHFEITLRPHASVLLHISLHSEIQAYNI